MIRISHLRLFLGLACAVSLTAVESLPLGSSARATRVDWQGIFLPESSPTGEEETDRRSVRTEVDMFSLTPSYSTADITLPMRGGEMSVEFRRRCTPYTYNLRCTAGGNPVPQSPVETVLGPCWSTNLAARVMYTMDAVPGGGYTMTIRVYDEDGAEYDFYPTTGTQTDCLPKLLNTFDNRALSVRLTPDVQSGTPNFFTLTKPHGLKLKFTKTDPVYPDGVGGPVVYTAHYYRLDTITDRNDNQIRYQYDIIHATTPANVTVTGHTTGAAGVNGSHLPTAIYDVKYPERKITFLYGYADGWDMNAYQIIWNRTDLVKQHTLSFRSRNPWRLLKATGPGSVAYDYRYMAPDAGGKIPASTWITSMDAAIPYMRGRLTAVDMPAVPIDTGTATSSQRPQVAFTYDIRTANDKQRYVTSNGVVWNFPGEQNLATPGGIVQWSQYEGINVFASLASIKDPRLNETNLSYDLAERPVSSSSAAAYMNGLTPAFWVQTRPVLSSITSSATNAAGTLVRPSAMFGLGGWSTTLQNSTVTDVRGNVTAFAFEFAFNNTSGVNNGFGAYLASKLTRTQGGRSVIHEFAPDVNSNLTRVTDMYGVVTDYAYTSGVAGDPFDQLMNPALAYNAFSNPRRYQLYDKPAKRTVGTQLPVAQQLVTQYRYTTAFNLLQQVTDPMGLVTTYGFDAKGNRTSQTIGGSNVTAYEYDANGDVTKVTDPAGRVTTMARTYMASTVQLKTVTTQTGYASGVSTGPFVAAQQIATEKVENAYGYLLTSKSPAAAVTTYTYDALGRQATEVLPAPASTSYRYYDKAGNVTRELDHVGNCTITTYDARNQPRTIRRRMTSATANNAADLITTKIFDATGLLLQETDPLGRVTSYTYDALLRLETKTLPPVVLVPGNSAQTFTETYAYGPNAGSGAWTIRSGWNPTRVTGADGVVTDAIYDGYYRRTNLIRRFPPVPSSSTAAIGANDEAEVTTYNAVHQPTSVTRYAQQWSGTALAAANRVTTIHYDNLHRKTLEILDMTGAGTGLALTKVVNDSFAETIPATCRASRSRLDAAGLVIASKDGTGALTETDYDGAGRPLVIRQPAVLQFNTTLASGTNTTVTGPATPTTTNVYQKHLLEKVTAANGTVTQFLYDARDRRTTTVVDLNGDGTFSTAINGADLVDVVGYDLMGNVNKTTDSRGNVTDILYDRAYRKTTITQASVINAALATPAAARPVTTTAYDLAGNPYLVTDARGNQSETVYDAWNRPISATQAKGSTVAVTTQTRYDSRGNVQSLILKDGTAAGVDQVTTYTYDDLHRKLTETLPTVDASVRQTQWSYTRNGEAYRKIDPKGQSVHIVFDRAGGMLSQTFKNSGGTTTDSRVYTYDNAGRPLTVVETTGTTTYTYDAIGRQLTEARQNTGDASATTVTSRYDAMGNRTWVDYPSAPAPLRMFTIYDRASRAVTLLEQDYGGTVRTTSYGYDQCGNRTSQINANNVNTTWTYDALNRNLLSETKDGGNTIISTLFAYDLVGNRVRMDEKTSGLAPRVVLYAYDAQNRLTSETY